MYNLEIIAKRIFNTLGTGFNEVIYQRALELELRLLGINYENEINIPIKYKGFEIGYGRSDIIIKNNEDILDIVLELKAINVLNGKETIQLKNYLRFSEIDNGILINFNQKTGVVEYNEVNVHDLCV
jgi:GxxExxY protein